MRQKRGGKAGHRTGSGPGSPNISSVGSPSTSGGSISLGSSNSSSGNSNSMNVSGKGGGSTGVKGGEPGSPLPGSPTAVQQREQIFTQQQQVYVHQLQLLRMAQQQQTAFPITDAVRTGFIFVGALFGMYVVFKDYGWALAVALAALMYMCGLFRFLSVLAKWLFHSVDGVSYNDALRRADIMMEPITKKVTHSGDSTTLSFGCSSMQGWRRSMEDAHTLMPLDDGGFFAVYDGHSGSATSKYCGGNLYNFVAGTAAFKEKNYTTALYDGFIAIDRHLLSHPVPDRSGCTAVVLFIKGDDLYCANAGDSRCVLCRDGEAFPLSIDHKPYLPTEQTRIERAGGYVWNRRVNGVLALSRAIGDFGFKQNAQVAWDQQAVTSAPEVRTTRLNRDKDEFAVIACDGIWDVLTSEQVVEFVRPRIQQRMPLGRICEQLMDMCLATLPFRVGCDNMSVIILQFKRGSNPATAAAAATGSSTAVSTVPTPVPASPSPSSLATCTTGVGASGAADGQEDESSPTTAAAATATGTNNTTTTAAAAAAAAAAVPEGSSTSPSPTDPTLFTPEQSGREESRSARTNPVHNTIIKAADVVMPPDATFVDQSESVHLPAALESAHRHNGTSPAATAEGGGATGLRRSERITDTPKGGRNLHSPMAQSREQAAGGGGSPRSSSGVPPLYAEENSSHFQGKSHQQQPRGSSGSSAFAHHTSKQQGSGNSNGDNNSTSTSSSPPSAFLTVAQPSFSSTSSLLQGKGGNRRSSPTVFPLTGTAFSRASKSPSTDETLSELDKLKSALSSGLQ